MTRALVRSESGQSLVELALALPVLLLCLIGIVDIGLAINSYATVTNASREAAISASINPNQTASQIRDVAVAKIAPLPTASISVTYYNGSSFVSWPLAGFTPNPSPTSIPIRVDVAYDWSASTIFIGQFFGGSARTFHGTSTSVATW